MTKLLPSPIFVITFWDLRSSCALSSNGYHFVSFVLGQIAEPLFNLGTAKVPGRACLARLVAQLVRATVPWFARFLIGTDFGFEKTPKARFARRVFVFSDPNYQIKGRVLLGSVLIMSV